MRTRFLALGITVLVVGSFAPSAALASGHSRSASASISPGAASVARAVPARWRHARARAVRQMDATRAAVASGSIARAVIASARLVHVRPALMRADPTSVAGLPMSLAAPANELLGAVQSASVAATRAVHGDRRSLTQLFDQAQTLAGRLTRTRSWSVLAHARALTAQLKSRVDLSQLFGAALLIARTIDRTLPALRAASLDTPAGVASLSTGCVTVNSPAVCIGGTGADTYDTDVPLLIDPGGDDTYTNSAGGADPTVTHLPVSVVIDLGGNDHYESHAPTTIGSAAVQGSGRVGGIGILVDAGGDDRYEASSINTPNLVAQGSSLEGVGILADLGGKDTYTAQQLTPGPAVLPGSGWDAALNAAGYASAGMGLLIDAGAEDDTYDLEDAPPLTGDEISVRSPSPQANGFGVGGLGGVGLWSDDGGTNAATLAAISPEIPADNERLEDGGRPLPETQGFGAGILGGTGIVLTGAGDDTIKEISSSAAQLLDVSRTFGIGEATAGLGLFGDAGGDDTYVAQADSLAAGSFVVDDACRCDGTLTEASSWGAKTVAFGVGYFAGGVAVMQDAGGDDTYTAIARSTATSTQVNDSTDPAATGAFASAEAGIVNIEATGIGALASAGFLLDSGGGDDRYDSTATSRADATATATQPDLPTDAQAASGTASSVGEGGGAAGFGMLVDIGGNDTYRSTSVSEATPPPQEGTVPGLASGIVQGAAVLGGGVLIDVNPGSPDADTFAQTPVLPACNGTTRGQSLWTDCGQGAGMGYNG